MYLHVSDREAVLLRPAYLFMLIGYWFSFLAVTFAVTMDAGLGSLKATTSPKLCIIAAENNLHPTHFSLPSRKSGRSEDLLVDQHTIYLQSTIPHHHRTL